MQIGVRTKFGSDEMIALERYLLDYQRAGALEASYVAGSSPRVGDLVLFNIALKKPERLEQLLLQLGEFANKENVCMQPVFG